MFFKENPRALNTLARGIMAQSTLNQGISILHLLDEETTEKNCSLNLDKNMDSISEFGHV